MMGNWNFIFPYAANLIAELCTGQEGSGTKLCTGQEGSGTKHMMESNATSRDGYTGNWSNEFRPHDESKQQDPTDDEWDVKEDEWVPVQHYPTTPSTPEPSQEPINTSRRPHRNRRERQSKNPWPYPSRNLNQSSKHSSSSPRPHPSQTSSLSPWPYPSRP